MQAAAGFGAISAAGAGNWQARLAHLSERQLQNLVKALSGCLYALPAEGRAVLILRAGLYGPPLSDARVARRLHIGLQRERFVEYSSILALQWEAAHGACGAGTMVSLWGPAQSPFAPLLSLADGGAGGAGASANQPSSQTGSASAELQPAGGLSLPSLIGLPSHSQAGDDLLIFGAIVLLAVLALAGNSRRRSVRRRRIGAALAGYAEFERSEFYRRVARTLARSRSVRKPPSRPPRRRPPR